MRRCGCGGWGRKRGLILLAASALGFGSLVYYFGYFRRAAAEPVRAPDSSYARYDETICEDLDNLFVMAVIRSKPENVEWREWVRSAWAANVVYEGRNVRSVFVTGRSGEDEANEAVAEEFARNRDIVQVNVPDLPDRGTDVMLLALRWVATFCSNSEFLFLTRDDFVFRLNALTHYLRGTYFPLYKDLYMGSEAENRTPVRVEGDSRYVGEGVYSPKTYPRYARGPNILLRIHTARLFGSMCADVPRVQLYDVFLGLCAKRWNVELTHLAFMAPPEPRNSSGILKGFCYYVNFLTFKMRDLVAQQTFFEIMQGARPLKC